MTIIKRLLVEPKRFYCSDKKLCQMAIVSIVLWSLIRFGFHSHLSMAQLVLSVEPLNPQLMIPEQTSDFFLYDSNKRFFQHCRQHMLHNDTFGQLIAPYVDKVAAKDLAREWSPSVSIVPTYDVWDAQDDWLRQMESLPQPFIVKPAHVSGTVGLIRNNTYHCIKGCSFYPDQVVPLAMRNRFTQFIFQWHYKRAMQSDYSRVFGERQYHYVPRRIIVEQALDMTQFSDVQYWYLSQGRILFVDVQCGKHGGSYVTSEFQPLRMALTLEPDYLPCPKPTAFEAMKQVALEMAPHIMGEHVVRLDLYASADQVFFSEMTFNSEACRWDYEPAVMDGLLYAVLSQQIPAEQVTAEYVERVVNDQSWVLVQEPLVVGGPVQHVSSHPSPLDLCRQVANTEECLQMAQTLESHLVRCMVLSPSRLGGRGSVVKAVGVDQAGYFPCQYINQATS